MNDRRDLRGRKLLDPTWHKLRDALDKLYAEIETDAMTRGLSVAVSNADGTLVTYIVDLRNGQLRRLLMTDRDAMVAAIKDSTIEVDHE
jgi:hypothetical protein